MSLIFLFFFSMLIFERGLFFVILFGFMLVVLEFIIVEVLGRYRLFILKGGIIVLIIF